MKIRDQQRILIVEKSIDWWYFKGVQWHPEQRHQEDILISLFAYFDIEFKLFKSAQSFITLQLMLKTKPILTWVVVVVTHQLAIILRVKFNRNFVSELCCGFVISLRNQKRWLELDNCGFVEVEAKAEGGSLFGEGWVEVEVVVLVNEVAWSQVE